MRSYRRLAESWQMYILSKRGKNLRGYERQVGEGACSRRLFTRARHLHRMRTRRVARDAFVESFGNLLAVAVAAKFLFVGGTADKGDLRQNARHGAFGEDHESRFLH